MGFLRSGTWPDPSTVSWTSGPCIGSAQSWSITALKWMNIEVLSAAATSWIFTSVVSNGFPCLSDFYRSHVAFFKTSSANRDCLNGFPRVPGHVEVRIVERMLWADGKEQLQYQGLRSLGRKPARACLQTFPGTLTMSASTVVGKTCSMWMFPNMFYLQNLWWWEREPVPLYTLQFQ